MPSSTGGRPRRKRALSRRVVLGGAVAGVAAVATAGCAEQEVQPRKAQPPDPETVLLTQVIADKERIIALYRQAALSQPALAAKLAPFEQRHQAHLAELKRRLPAGSGPASPAPGAPSSSSSPAPSSPAPSATGSPGKVSLARLRRTERDAAASRPRQLASVSPALAQLLAGIGACEAAQAEALKD